MIHKSFDKSEELINPIYTLKESDIKIASKHKIDVFIIVFSHRLIDLLKEKEVIEIINKDLKLGTAAFKDYVYRIKDTNIGVFLSGIGAPVAVASIEELSALFNCKNYIVFGSCGALVEIEEAKIIIPNYAYRDEGTSYHYTDTGSFIEIKNSKKLAKIFDELEVDYVVGKTWTTDAFYRETKNNKESRVKDGCICVEMECSALQAVCDFRGLQLYQFVYAADSLNDTWLRRILGEMENDSRLAYFSLAKQVALKL